MAPVSNATRQILALAEAYARHTGVDPDKLSGPIVGKGGFLRRLRAGSDCHTATAERVIEWFASEWPEGVAWPADVPRPGRMLPGQSLVPSELRAVADADEAAFVARLAHLPLWKNGRRPAWWKDSEVKVFLVRAHRQMTIGQAAKEGAARFGGRCPKKSAIHDFWQRLDRVQQSPKSKVA